MDTTILMEIENLRRASLDGVRVRYQEVFKEETRCRHRKHLFRKIAWRLQALAEGDRRLHSALAVERRALFASD